MPVCRGGAACPGLPDRPARGRGGGPTSWRQPELASGSPPTLPNHRRSQRQVETIIIFRIGSLGDTVVALPCFHRIARSFANSRRILVTNVAVSQKAAPAESVLD